MATKAGQANAAGHVRPARPSKTVLELERLRDTYGLSRRALARSLGITGASLAAWESGKRQPGAEELANVRRLKAVLKRAAGVMRTSYIPAWLEKPSEACAELGAATPLDLLARGDFQAVEDLLYYLGSGVPF